MDKPIEPTVPLAEAAKRCGCRAQTLRSAINRGRLPARKPARDWLVNVGQVREYLASRWKQPVVSR